MAGTVAAGLAAPTLLRAQTTTIRWGESLAASAEEITAADSYEEIESVDEEYDLTSELTDYDEAELFFATAPVEAGAAVFAEFLP